MFQMPMFGQQDSRAKTSPLQEWEGVTDFEGPNQDSFLRLLALLESVVLESLSSKTSTAFSLATEDETLPSYSKRWTNSGMVWRGACLTVNTSESPSHDVGSTLSEYIKTPDAPLKYFLSPNAARGILRRADRMGRNLIPSFRQSLEILALGT